ncbi:MAG TPA: DUF5615 family PIN-like protein [Isosphaeraceae bacterium]|nr:DUF5615 family PIN-like protein [Isosphaeraceae bacterium]
MNFKLDENLHPENGELLRERGHDVATVHDRGLRGHEDQEIAEVCRQEGRILLSFDRLNPPQATRLQPVVRRVYPEWNHQDGHP